MTFARFVSRCPSLETFDRHVSGNVWASWQLIREFALQLPNGFSRHAAFIAMASDHAAYNLPYGASKGALDRIVLAAVREINHLRITANVVEPRPTDTS